MFLFKKKEEPVKTLKAYISGMVIPITEVKDEVFSSGILGDGVAIWPNGEIITAPCNGEVSVVAEGSRHAVGMKLNNGMELLLHAGLDTVNLNGEGFRAFVKEGDKVKLGDKLLKFDKDFIESKGLESICILVITNSGNYSDIKYITGIEAEQNKTEICVF